jgi:hypothetical protein
MTDAVVVFAIGQIIGFALVFANAVNQDIDRFVAAVE